MALGRRQSCLGNLHRAMATVLAMLISVASAAPSSAATLDDLLFDLQFVPLDNRPAPTFTLSGLDGTPVSLTQFKGRVVLLYFWATW
jgi:cytochrome oxidase Cu insertion factor (SCO1/SenC/PrrC family)